MLALVRKMKKQSIKLQKTAKNCITCKYMVSLSWRSSCGTLFSPLFKKQLKIEKSIMYLGALGRYALVDSWTSRSSISAHPTTYQKQKS
jgi:hypothetical protein